jgi:hypothetical protein
VTFFGTFLRTRPSVQIIPTHWMNLRKAFKKQLHLSRSVNSKVVSNNIFKRIEVHVREEGINF